MRRSSLRWVPVLLALVVIIASLPLDLWHSAAQELYNPNPDTLLLSASDDLTNLAVAVNRVAAPLPDAQLTLTLPSAALLVNSLQLSVPGGALAITEDAAFYNAEIASYLISPHRSDHSIGVSAAQYLGWAMPAAGGAEVSGMAGWRAAGCLEALATAELEGRLRRELRNQGMEELLDEVEMPLSMLLFRMERAGIGIDLERLADVGAELSRMLQELATRIWALAGAEFNIDSPKQVAEVLFEQLRLPKGRKTSTGWSTAASILEELAAEYAGRVKIVQVNVDENGDLASRYNVRGIPALFVINGGQTVDQTVGLQSKADLARMLNKHIG